MVFLDLRDTDVEVSMSAMAPATTLDAGGPAVREGARVVLRVEPRFYAKRGTLSLWVQVVRPLGEGELLARVEQLKRTLAGEGLFAAERKRPLPFLPRASGLVCGRGSAAEQDVVENARRRWPSVRIEVREVAVQGPTAVQQVGEAVAELDTLAHVEVIVVARGGGSTEDLLPFSNEALLRTVAACRTPVVSAIGHEEDTPLLDLVADVRASTPTDAARRVVPDAAHELATVGAARERGRHAVRWPPAPGAGAGAPAACPARAHRPAGAVRRSGQPWWRTAGPGCAQRRDAACSVATSSSRRRWRTCGPCPPQPPSDVATPS